MMQRRRTIRRGFATIMAVALIVVVATAMAALSQRLAQDVRRTKDERHESQLRQLLHAGTIEVITVARRAPAALDEAFGKPLEPALPADILSMRGSLTIRPEKAGADWLLHISASLDGRTREQTLRLAPKDGRWRIVDLSTP